MKNTLASSFLILNSYFVKLSRLRGRKICAHLLRKGTVWKGKTMVIRYLKGAPRHPAADPAVAAVYVGTIASTKLDKSAVKRNRMRRRCREALRTALLEKDTFPTIQLLVGPKSGSLTAPFTDIKSDIDTFLVYIHGRQSETRQ